VRLPVVFQFPQGGQPPLPPKRRPNELPPVTVTAWSM
jgi:hypothetical protein